MELIALSILADLTIWRVLLFFLCLLIMLFGVIGVFIPVLPGLPIVWAGLFIYSAATGFDTISGDFLIYSAIAVAIAYLLQHWLVLYGARRFGSSVWGMIGAFIGMVLGVLFGSLLGLILGPLVGAILFELLVGRGFKEACRAGFGSFIGFTVGTLLQLALGFFLIGTLVVSVFFG